MLTMQKMKQGYDMAISKLEDTIERLQKNMNILLGEINRLENKYTILAQAVDHPNGSLVFTDEAVTAVTVGEKIAFGNKVHIVYHYVKNGELKKTSVGTFDKYYSEDGDGCYDLLEKFSYVRNTKGDIATIVIGDRTFYINLK